VGQMAVDAVTPAMGLGDGDHGAVDVARFDRARGDGDNGAFRRGLRSAPSPCPIST
jgi:hypothetical protein